MKTLACLALVLFATLALVSAEPVEAAANRVSATQTCSNFGVELTLRWAPNNLSARQQWVEISLSNNGWEYGTFAIGQVPSDSDLIGIVGLYGGTSYYVRVAQRLSDDRIDFSPTFYLLTIPCPNAPVAATPGSTGSPTAPGTAGTQPVVAPVTGTNCHPSYLGACLQQNAVDYDCLGSGDGPLYVRGPINVDGPDVYGLDDNGDGIACNP